MSTHTLEVAQEMCDRISIILKGRIIAQRHGGRAPRDGRRRRRSADVGVPEADRRQRAAGDRRGRLMVRAFPYLLLPHVLSSRNRARRRERGDLHARRCCSAASASLVCARAVPGRVLADGAARRLRGARRLPAAPRPVVAVPDVPLVPRLQRRRHGAVDVLPVRRSAAAAGGAGRDAAAVPRALRAHGRPGVVDGRDLPRAGADGRRARALRRPVVLR